MPPGSLHQILFTRAQRSEFSQLYEKLSVLASYHHASSAKYARIHLGLSISGFIMGLTSTFLSTVLASSPHAQLVASLLSLLFSIVAAIQGFIAPSKRDAQHLHASHQYRDLADQVRLVAHTHVDSPTAAALQAEGFSTIMRKYMDTFKAIEEGAPAPDAAVVERITRQIGPGVSLPIDAGAAALHDTAAEFESSADLSSPSSSTTTPTATE